MEGVGVVQGEHQYGGLGVLVVAGGHAGHSLHAPGVPQLQLHLLLLDTEDFAVMIKSYRGLSVRGAGKGVTHKPPEQGGLPNTVLPTEDHFLLGYLDRGLNRTESVIIIFLITVYPNLTILSSQFRTRLIIIDLSSLCDIYISSLAW